MTLPERFSYSFVEIAELLVKKADLHEGHWGLYVEFGLNATNIVTEAPKTMLPAAIIPIVKMGLQRFPEPNLLSVDAAKVNPPHPHK
jgi:hypothetical protein